MTKFYINGPYRCHQCLQLRAELGPEGGNCQLCSTADSTETNPNPATTEPATPESATPESTNVDEPMEAITEEPGFWQILRAFLNLSIVAP